MKKVFPAVALAIFAAGAQAEQPAMQDANGMKWVCGGVSADGRKELAPLEKESNLALTFVTAKRSGYLADVDVALYESGAKTPRLTLKADGPMCLLNVPPGKYRIEATYDGNKRTVAAMVAKETKHPVRVGIAFPGEKWDGITASPEEKRQAKEP